jgi:pimeloyl-ACP methyl ester carboxylesterase
LCRRPQTRIGGRGPAHHGRTDGIDPSGALVDEVVVERGDRGRHAPREWAERLYHVARWTRMPRGGHFAAAEEPALLADDLTSFFGSLA